MLHILFSLAPCLVGACGGATSIQPSEMTELQKAPLFKQVFLERGRAGYNNLSLVTSYKTSRGDTILCGVAGNGTDADNITDLSWFYARFKKGELASYREDDLAQAACKQAKSGKINLPH